MTYSWVFRRARLLDGREVDIALAGERIAAVAPGLTGVGQRELDLKGRLVLPGLVDIHVHLDKNFTARAVPNRSGTLDEAIQGWLSYKAGLSKSDYLARARRGLELAVRQGTLYFRTHVDVDAGGLTALEALLELRQTLPLTLQVVALGNPGVSPAEDRAMEEALGMGADVIGACPAITPEPLATLQAALELALRWNRPVDFHLDEHQDPRTMLLGELAYRVRTMGLEGQVVAGHCVALAFAPQFQAEKVMEEVRVARVGVVALPSSNLALQGRQAQPPPRGLTRIKELRALGVQLAIASDNVQDPFQPLGNYDLLFSAQLAALAGHLTAQHELEDCLRMVSEVPAALMGLREYGLKEGSLANLVVFDADSPEEALGLMPRRQVFVRGEPLEEMTWSW